MDQVGLLAAAAEKNKHRHQHGDSLEISGETSSKPWTFFHSHLPDILAFAGKKTFPLAFPEKQQQCSR